MSFSSRRFSLKSVSDYADFCGNHQLNFDLVDKQKAEMLAELIRVGSPISLLSNMFDDNFDVLAQTAVYLFSIDKITREQTATILEYKDMLFASSTEQHPLFKDNGKLTIEAVSLLGNFMSSEEEKKFVEIMKSKPYSEQCYFKLMIPKEDMENVRLMGLVELANNLKIIKKNHIPIARPHSEGYSELAGITQPIITVFSVGARDAMNKAIYGSHAKTLLPRLGKFIIEDIERSMMNNARYSAISYPGIETEKSFHRITANMFYLSLHDEVHRRLASSIPNGVYDAFLFAIDRIREKTGIKWSKEIWESIDMEVGSFFSLSSFIRDMYSEQQPTMGLTILCESTVYTEDRQRGLFDSSNLLDTTWLFVIDLILNKQQWADFGISIPALLQQSAYSQMIAFVNANIDAIKNEPSPAKQVAIIKAKFFNLPEVKSADVQFAKEEGSNFLQVLVDGKPLVMSKSKYLDLKKKIHIDRLANGGKVDVENIVNLPPDILELFEFKTIVKLLIKQKLTVSDMKDLSPKMRERIAMLSIYDLLIADKVTFTQLKSMTDAELKQCQQSLSKTFEPHLPKIKTNLPFEPAYLPQARSNSGAPTLFELITKVKLKKQQESEIKTSLDESEKSQKPRK